MSCTAEVKLEAQPYVDTAKVANFTRARKVKPGKAIAPAHGGDVRLPNIRLSARVLPAAFSVRVKGDTALHTPARR